MNQYQRLPDVYYIHPYHVTNDKENVHNADINRCYDLVKHLPLKRYTLSEVIYPKESNFDRTKLGWIESDLQQFLPKSSKKIDRIAQQNIIELANPDGTMGKKTLSYSIAKDVPITKPEQVYAHMYGALQKVIEDKEALEKKIESQNKTINELLIWALSQGYKSSE